MRIVTALFLQLAFLVLTFTTGIIGAAPLLLLFSLLDKVSILILQLVTVAALCYFQLYAPAVLVLCLWFMVQAYSNLHKISFFNRTFIAASTASVLFLAIVGYGIYAMSPNDFWGYIAGGIEKYLKESQSITGPFEINVQKIVYQMPSVVVCIFAINMWLATVFEKGSRISILQRKSNKDLKNYRAPEAFIWVVILSLLFSFLETPVKGLQEVALNTLNISLLLYFFQGLSVLSFIMEQLKFNPLLRMIVNFLFIIQIILPICLGILDFWLNFRSKISKKTE